MVDDLRWDRHRASATLLVLLDISAAFNTRDHGILLRPDECGSGQNGFAVDALLPGRHWGGWHHITVDIILPVWHIPEKVVLED